MTRLAEFAMLAQGWRRFLLLFVAGAIGGLSVPPFYFLPALFVSMPIWVWALDGAERSFSVALRAITVADMVKRAHLPA